MPILALLPISFNYEKPRIGCYRELFDLSMACDESAELVDDKVRKAQKKVPSKKILMKCEPGVGKTTL